MRIIYIVKVEPRYFWGIISSEWRVASYYGYKNTFNPRPCVLKRAGSSDNISKKKAFMGKMFY